MFGCALSDSNIFKNGSTCDHGNTGKVFFLPNISCILKRKRRVAVTYIPVLSFSDYQWQALHNSPLSTGAIWFLLFGKRGTPEKKTRLHPVAAFTVVPAIVWQCPFLSQEGLADSSGGTSRGRMHLTLDVCCIQGDSAVIAALAETASAEGLGSTQPYYLLLFLPPCRTMLA